MEQAVLRKAFSQFATGVAIITARPPGRGEEKGSVYGMTVNSFTSLSLDPPLLLWCLGTSGSEESAYRLFKEVDSFSASILSSEQEDLARSMAQHHQHTLPEDKVDENLFIDQCVAGFTCSVQEKIPAGDHLILIGLIGECKIINEEAKPLVFYQKTYSELK